MTEENRKPFKVIYSKDELSDIIKGFSEPKYSNLRGINMTDENIPEICIKSDETDSKITELENENDFLKIEIYEKTERIKEYLQILKDASVAGINPPDVVHGPVEYFEKKIRELNTELLSTDEAIRDSTKELAELRMELEDLTEKVHESGYVKIHEQGTLISREHIRWITADEADKWRNNMWVTRIV